MASDDEEEDLEALRNAVFASMKRPPIPDNAEQGHQPVLSISNPEKRPIVKSQTYSYHNQAPSNYSQQRGIGRNPPFGRGRAGNANLIVINTEPDKEDIEPARPTAGSGPVFVDRRLEKRAPGVAITSHSSTPPRPKATGKFSRFDSSSSESEDSSSESEESDKDSSFHSDNDDDNPPEISFDANESSESDRKSNNSSETSESSDESDHNAPVPEKSAQMNSNAVKSNAITPSPKEKMKNDSNVRYVVPPSTDLLSNKSISVTVKRRVSHERKTKPLPDDRHSEITRRPSTERKAVNSLKEKRASSLEKVKPDNSSDKCIKPLMSNEELTTLAARKRKFDSSRIVGGENIKKTISLKGILPKKSKEKKNLKKSKPNQKRKSVSPNRSVRKLKSEKLKKSKTPESKKVLIHKRVVSSDSEDSTDKSSSSDVSDSDNDDSTSMRSSLKTERNLDDIARERRQRVTKKDRAISDLTHSRSAFMNTSNPSHGTQNYKEHRRKRFFEEIEDDERPKKRFVSCIVRPRSEGRKDVLLSNRTVKDHHREKQWSSGSEASSENRPTDRQFKCSHADRRKQVKHDSRSRINAEKSAVTGHRETFKPGEGRISPAVNVTFNSDKSLQKERPKVKRSVLERLGAPVKDGGRKRPISPSSSSGQRRQVVSYDEDYPASTGENARKHRRAEKEDISGGRNKSSQAHKSSMSATKESSRRNTSKSKGGGDDELDDRIHKIQEKNAAILKRKQEVERDRKIYG